jgi:hypothetical protein
MTNTAASSTSTAVAGPADHHPAPAVVAASAVASSNKERPIARRPTGRADVPMQPQDASGTTILA